MSDLVTVILIALATYRISRFFAVDTLFEPVRLPVQEWFERRWLRRQPAEDQADMAASEQWNSKVSYLLSCPWCLSIWVGAGVVAGVDYLTSVPLPMLVWLTSSAVAGFLSSKEG